MKSQTILRALINAVGTSAAIGQYLSDDHDRPNKRMKETYRRRERQARKFEAYLSKRLELERSEK